MFQITKPIRSISIQSALGEIVFDRHDIHYAEANVNKGNCWAVFCAYRKFTANVANTALATAVIRNYFLRYGVFSVTIDINGEINREGDSTVKFCKPRVLEVVMRDHDRDEAIRFQRLMQAQLDSLQELTFETNEEFLRQTGRTASFIDYLPEGANVVVERELEKKLITRISQEVGTRTTVVSLEELVEYIKSNPAVFCWTEGGNNAYYKRYLSAISAANNQESED